MDPSAPTEVSSKSKSSRPRRVWNGMRGYFRKKWEGKSWWKKGMLLCFWVLGGFVVLSILSTLIFAILPVPVTPLMLIRCGQQVLNGDELILKKDWVNGSNISNHIKLAVICAEDQNFLDHNGFDILAIKKALDHNKRSRKKRGASTISQQTAKNVFLWPGRSWVRKGLEVWFTGLIEVLWSKKRIITVYLNIAELGPGVYGVEAASKQYFKKTAKKLSPSEAALLAAVLPSPLRYSVKRPGPFVQRRQQWVMRQMRMFGGISYLETQPNW